MISVHCLRAPSTAIEASALWLAAIILSLLAAGAARADSWSLPKEETYVSASGRVRIVVTPRDIAGPLEYFRDRVRETPLAGQRPGSSRTSALGHLQARDEAGRWRTIWAKPLINDVAPVTALVADSGRFVVTFDNWHSTGLGENVIVIYDSTGTVVRSLALTDLFPAYFVDALPRSVSSIWWSGVHRLDEANDRLILSVVMPGSDMWEERRDYFEVSVDLTTGTADPLPEADWRRARDLACRDLIETRESRLQLEEYLRSPLLAPGNADERSWSDYSQEAIARLEIPAPLPEEAPDDALAEDMLADPLGDVVTPMTTVLREPAADDYSASVGWVRDALREAPYPPDDVRTFVSPSQDNLVRVLEREARRLRPGSLSGARLYIAVEGRYWQRIEAALAASGATLIQLDPTRPIPQRPERLAGRQPVPELARECEPLA
jgi:hypothetical protein